MYNRASIEAHGLDWTRMGAGLDERGASRVYTGDLDAASGS
jgi:hypothetical protein